MREQQSARAGTRRGERRLGAGVAAAHHDHVELPGKIHAEWRRGGGAACHFRDDEILREMRLRL